MNWLLKLIGLDVSRKFRGNQMGAIMASDDNADDNGRGFDSETKLSFAETVEHLNRGFEHTQRVVQFMDAKASGVIAFSLAVFAFIAKVIAWVYGVAGSGFLTKWQDPAIWIHGFIALLVAFASYQGGMCLYRAFSTIRPNGLPSKERFTSLFPARESASKQKDSEDYLSGFVAGECRLRVLAEFKSQLLDMGGIIYFKIRELQKSITHLRRQGVLAVVIGAVVGMSAGFGLIDCPVKEPKPAVAVPAHVQPAK